MKHPIAHFSFAILFEPWWNIVALKIVVVYYHSLFSEMVFALAAKKIFHIAANVEVLVDCLPLPVEASHQAVEFDVLQLWKRSLHSVRNLLPGSFRKNMCIQCDLIKRFQGS